MHLKGAAALLCVAAVGTVVAVCSQTWGSRQVPADELLVLGPLGIGSSTPWVLDGGAEGVLGQLSYAQNTRDAFHQHLKFASKDASRKVHLHRPRGREQQLEEQEKDEDDPVSVLHHALGTASVKITFRDVSSPF